MTSFHFCYFFSGFDNMVSENARPPMKKGDFDVKEIVLRHRGCMARSVKKIFILN